MDWEGKVVASQLHCTASGRTLAVGELFFSGLTIADGQFTRQDFSAEAWENQDKQRFLSWWRQRVPEPDQTRRAFKLNAETLAQIFANLKDSRSRIQQCLAYVVALGLVRARKLHFVEVTKNDDLSLLVIEDRHRGVIHRLRDPGMSPDEEQQVLDNLLAVTVSGETVE